LDKKNLMIKIITILLLINIIINKNQEDKYEWELKEYKGNIESTNFQVYPYNKEAKQIKFTIKCSNACKIMMLTKKELKNFQNRQVIFLFL
jgi:hypothetical protein